MRKTSALIVALGLVASLTACSNVGQSASCTGSADSVGTGDAAALVTATGKLGEQPVVDFPMPLFATKTQRAELIRGTGPMLELGQSATIEATILNGADGTVLQTTSYGPDGGSLITVGPSGIPGLTLGLECARVGSRVAIVASAKDSTGGQGNPNLGLTTKDSLVFVVDIKAGYLAKADGAPQITPPSIPSVVLAPNGRPGIIVPGGPAPTKLQVAVEKQGNGAKVAKGDYAVLKYTGIVWSDHSVFDSTWAADTATVVQVAPGTLVDGFIQGITGQRVGSQVVIVIPPKDGYGSAGNGSSVPPNSTLVYVVDILGIAK